MYLYDGASQNVDQVFSVCNCQQCIDVLNALIVMALHLSFLVHIRIFYIRANLWVLQHLNVKCSMQMFILCKNDVILWSWSLILIFLSISHNNLMVCIYLKITFYACCRCTSRDKISCIAGNVQWNFRT